MKRMYIYKLSLYLSIVCLTVTLFTINCQAEAEVSPQIETVVTPELMIKVIQGDKSAMNKLQKLAESGDKNAQCNLGMFYEEGKLLPKDYKLAVHYLQKAAASGLALAQSHLGLMYFEGHGVRQSYTDAYYWYHLAAEQGDNFGIFNLAFSFASGLGVKEANMPASYALIQLAIAAGFQDSNNVTKVVDDLMTESSRKTARLLAKAAVNTMSIKPIEDYLKQRDEAIYKSRLDSIQKTGH